MKVLVFFLCVLGIQCSDILDFFTSDPVPTATKTKKAKTHAPSPAVTSAPQVSMAPPLPSMIPNDTFPDLNGTFPDLPFNDTIPPVNQTAPLPFPPAGTPTDTPVRNPSSQNAQSAASAYHVPTALVLAILCVLMI
jgi:hypothetical protein